MCPDSDLRVLASSILFNISEVYHFNTVKNSNKAEAGHTRSLDMCSRRSIHSEVSVSLLR